MPGIGKTQLAIQLAVDVQIPEAFQGVCGEAIYIDTEGSFMVERALQMGASVMKHLSSIAKHHARPAQVEAVATLAGLGDGGRAFLRGVHVMRCHNQAELLAAVHHLPALLQQHPKGKSRGRNAAPAVQYQCLCAPCFWPIPVPLDLFPRWVWPLQRFYLFFTQCGWW